MNRIEPQTIKAFFLARPDLRPIRNSFVREDDDHEVIGCCGLTAALMDSGKGDALNCTLDELNDLGERDAAQEIGIILGLDGDYAHGFCQGWDGTDPGPWPYYGLDPERLGAVDGRAAWKSCHEVTP